MKIVIFLTISYFSFFSYSFSANLVNCNQFDKISAKFVECKAKNLKNNLNKKHKKIKSATGEKIKKTMLKEKFTKFKNSKTLVDFFKKNND